MSSATKPDGLQISGDVARAIVSATPDALVMADAQGTIELVNDQALALFGYAATTDMVGSKLEMLLPDRFAQVHVAHRTRYVAEPSVRMMGSGMDLLAKRADGSEVPVEVSLSPFEIAGRLRVIATVRDISERLAIEHEARVVQTALDASADGIFMFRADDTMHFTYVNEGAVAQVGYSRDELLVMSPLHITPLIARADYRSMIQPLVDKNLSSLDFRTVHRRKDGVDVPVEILLQRSPDFDDDHEASLLVAQVRDITDRTRTEQQLIASTRRFGAAFQDGPVAMSIVEISPTADRVVVEANHALADMLGYPLDDLIGMSVVDFTHPDDLAADDAATEAQLEGENDAFSGRKRYVRADGGVVWVDLHVAVLETDGDTVRTIGHSSDVTAQVAAEERTARDQATLRGLTNVQATLLAESPINETLKDICRHARRLVSADSAVFARPASSDDGDPLLNPVVFDASPTAPSPSALLVDDVIRPVLDGTDVEVGGEGPEGPVSTLLVPVESTNGVDGVLIVYRTSASGPLEDHDREAMTGFAKATATALQLDSARRNQKRTELLEDRERIGRDMHDLVIGRLFATGMALQSTTARIEDRATQDRLMSAVGEIDETIKEIRSSIYGIRSQEGWAKGAKGEILSAAADVQDQLGFEPRVTLAGPIDDLPANVVEQLVAALRESLTNAAKYANATSVSVRVDAEPGRVVATVRDDGVGFDPASITSTDGHGNGLGNIASRASTLGGHGEVTSALGEGTTVSWSVPLAPEQAGPATNQ